MGLSRVVVTGMGALTPIGNTVDSFWKALLEGKNGAAEITLLDDISHCKTRFACEVKDFVPEDFIGPRLSRRMDRFSQLAYVAAVQAIDDADLSNVDKTEVGVIASSGIGGIRTIEEELGPFFTKGADKHRFSPFFIPKYIIDIVAGWISIKYGFQGPNFGVVSACASSAHAIITAMGLLRSGQAKVMVTGGSEAAISHSGICGFNALKALSERNDDYETASRPFDKDRDGFVLGEGAAYLVLEEYEHARARGAHIYAELLGAGMSADAYHLTAPQPEGTGVRLAMNRALKDAGIRPEDVHYLNAHATATLLGDIAEIRAIQEVFGEHAYKLFIGATKSMTGHMLGAIGATEAIVSIKALETGKMPPTINHFELDPALDERLNYCFDTAQSADLEVTLTNSFGFGGHNTTIVFRRCED